MSMTAYRAENAKSAFDTDWSTTKTALETAGYIKSGLTASEGTYTLYNSATVDGIYLVMESDKLGDDTSNVFIYEVE
jgi:hypothetical protein